jgi:four helix bundle protein
MDQNMTVCAKSYQLALEIVKLCLRLKKQNRCEIAAPLLRCGTSIGANIEEAPASQAAKTSFIKCQLLPKRREKHTIG